MTFRNFVNHSLKTARAARDIRQPVTAAHPLLNGVPYSIFRKEVDIETRREIGAFFSGDSLAQVLASQIAERIDTDAVVLDPTCGIGDLLLARAAILPVGKTLRATLSLWGDRLSGLDTNRDLVKLAKIRLCMLARARGGFTADINPLDEFPNIVAQDMFSPKSEHLLRRADAILFNPPFGKTVWKKELTWASGEINAAAIFLDSLTATVRPTVPIAAVLPEVLRCGSRYARFRSLLVERGYGGAYRAHGRFDTWTDVDVFTTLMARRSQNELLWRSPLTAEQRRVEDVFDVCVGAVVPHRDANKGPWRAYICAKTTLAWEASFTPKASRRFAGRTFNPPFVAIRRTSSPSDKMRAVGTIVTGQKPIAVENHLLVATPQNGSLRSCNDLLEVLRSPNTNRQLNELMRCRHLTTGAIKQLPWVAPDE